VRISEALALRWDDIDFKRQVIRVYRSANGDGQGSTKGKRFRPVQVGPGLLRTLHGVRTIAALREGAALAQARVFAMPVRTRKAERGRWHSKEAFAPVDWSTVSSAWHKQARRLGSATCPPAYGRGRLAPHRAPLILAARTALRVASAQISRFAAALVERPFHGNGARHAR
jgi:integrase